MEIWLIVGLIAVWLVFQLWLGPKLGIPTCLRGGCSVRPGKDAEEP